MSDTVSQGKIKRWLRCRREFYLHYSEKLRRRRYKRPLKFGTLVHDMLEAHANKKDPFAVLDNMDLKELKLFKVQEDELGDIIEDVRMIMTEYFDHYPKADLRYIKVANSYAEHHFEIEILPGVIWQGYIDAVGRTPNKLRWMVENKTFKSRPSEDHYWRNLQSISYIRAIDIMGWPAVEGTLWNYISSQAPRSPDILKSGALSQSKSIRTTPRVFLAAIKEHGLDKRDYADVLKALEYRMEDWYFRVHTPILRAVTDYMFGEFVFNVQDMLDNRGDKEHSPMAIDRHCEWCDYEPLCRAELTGGDVDFIKEREYIVDGKSTRKTANKSNKAGKANTRHRGRK